MSSSAEPRALFAIEYRTIPADPAPASGGDPVPEVSWVRAEGVYQTAGAAQAQIDWVAATFPRRGREWRVVPYESVSTLELTPKPVPIDGAARELFVVEYRTIGPAKPSGFVGNPVPGGGAWRTKGSGFATEGEAQACIDRLSATLGTRAGVGQEWRIVRYAPVPPPAVAAYRHLFIIESREMQGEPASLLEESIPEVPWRASTDTYPDMSAALRVIDWLERQPEEKGRERRIVRYVPAYAPDFAGIEEVSSISGRGPSRNAPPPHDIPRASVRATLESLQATLAGPRETAITKDRTLGAAHPDDVFIVTPLYGTTASAHRTEAGAQITLAAVKAIGANTGAAIEALSKMAITRYVPIEAVRASLEASLARSEEHSRTLATVAEAIADAAKTRAVAQAELAQLREALALATPWPFHEVLLRLADAADHLLSVHDCDTHGWEGITEARDAGRRIADAMTSNREACPECGRGKACNIYDVKRGRCPKWWARPPRAPFRTIRDAAAEADCAAAAAHTKACREEADDTVHDTAGRHDIDAVARQTPEERAAAAGEAEVTFLLHPHVGGAASFTIQVRSTQIFADAPAAEKAATGAVRQFEYMLRGTPLDALVELAAGQAKLTEINGGPLCPRSLPDQINSVVNLERMRAEGNLRAEHNAARNALVKINGGDLGTGTLAENIEGVFEGVCLVNRNGLRLQRERAVAAEEKLARAVKGLRDFTYEGHLGRTDIVDWPCDGTCRSDGPEGEAVGLNTSCVDHLPGITVDDRCSDRDECSRCQALDLAEELAGETPPAAFSEMPAASIREALAVGEALLPKAVEAGFIIGVAWGRSDFVPGCLAADHKRIAQNWIAGDVKTTLAALVELVKTGEAP